MSHNRFFSIATVENLNRPAVTTQAITPSGGKCSGTVSLFFLIAAFVYGTICLMHALLVKNLSLEHTTTTNVLLAKVYLDRNTKIFWNSLSHSRVLRKTSIEKAIREFLLLQWKKKICWLTRSVSQFLQKVYRKIRILHGNEQDLEIFVQNLEPQDI